MYFTDRGIEELQARRGDEEVTFDWLAEQLRTFVDLNPDFEVPVERLATWLARLRRRGRVNEQMSDEQPDDAGAPIEFRPSLDAQVVPEGPRDLAIVFLGASLVAGVGDPKGQGWVTGSWGAPSTRTSADRLQPRRARRHSADVLQRWASEVPLRWAGRTERRVVLSVGTNDVASGITLARHRLNLANLLDDAASSGVGAFVVSPPPTADAGSTSASRCSSTPRPTCAPDAACPSSTATPPSWAMTSGAPTWRRAASRTTPDRPGTA